MFFHTYAQVVASHIAELDNVCPMGIATSEKSTSVRLSKIVPIRCSKIIITHAKKKIALKIRNQTPYTRIISEV